MSISCHSTMKIPPRFKSCSVAYYNAAGIHLYKNANALVIYSTWVIAQCHSKLHKNQLKSNQNSLGIWIFAPKKLSHESDALSKTKSMPISILIFSVKIQIGRYSNIYLILARKFKSIFFYSDLFVTSIPMESLKNLPNHPWDFWQKSLAEI